jgi:predicted nucleotidyltransferase
MAISEQQIQNWARALSETENDKCVKTVASIRKILEDYFGSKVKVFLQGSYANSTNVRQDSDVDIIVCYSNAYYSDISSLTDQEKVIHNQNWVAHGYEFSTFKNDVESLLHTNFGNFVIRKEKCLTISENTYRVSADVVPCFTHKRFHAPQTLSAEGVHLFTDTGSNPVINFPDQHKTNGQTKNQSTNQKYKAVVRILKNCRNHLIDNNHIDEKFMPSFLLESLVWNVPDNYFNTTSHKDAVNNVISKIYADMADQTVANNYAEINDLVYLFRGSDKKTPAEVKTFLEHVYNIIN